MTLKESVQINALPEAIWPFLTNFEVLASWNPKIQQVAPVSTGPFRVGSQYRVQYQMSGRPSEFLAEVKECQCPTRLSIQYLPQSSQPGTVLETFSLQAKNGGTSIQHRLEIRHTGINIILQALIWFVNRFGKTKGLGPLEHLKAAVEAQNPVPPRRVEIR